MHAADPSSNINKDGTVKEHGEGTLDKCKCGAEFFLSFANGLCCNNCKTKIKITDDIVNEVFRKHSKRD